MNRRLASLIAVIGAVLAVGVVAGIVAFAAGSSPDRSVGPVAAAGGPALSIQERRPMPGNGNGNGGPGFGMPGFGSQMGPVTRSAAPMRDTGFAVFVEIVRIVEFLILVGVFIWVVRALLAHFAAGRAVPRQGARDELDMLYARGEVSRDDYLARRADLG